MVPEKSSISSTPATTLQQPLENAAQNDDMRIAWRYNNLDKVNAEQGNQKNSYTFDLSQSINDGALNSHDITLFGKANDAEAHSTDSSIFHNPAYVSLLQKLQQKLSNATFEAVGGQSSTSSLSSSTATTTTTKNLLRICIESFGSPLWYTEHFTEDICLFLTILKAIVRVSLSVCCITVPTHLFKYIVCSIESNLNLLIRINHIYLCHFLMSFVESIINSSFTEFGGLCN